MSVYGQGETLSQVIWIPSRNDALYVVECQVYEIEMKVEQPVSQNRSSIFMEYGQYDTGEIILSLKLPIFT